MNIVLIQSPNGDDKMVVAVRHIVAIEIEPDMDRVLLYTYGKTIVIDTDTPATTFEHIKEAMKRD